VVSTNRLQFGNETLCKNDLNVELRSEDCTSTSDALKVEIVAISSPVAFDSGNDNMHNLNLQTQIYLKKKYSLISHCNIYKSKTLHLSPLITKLQI
jgi:hypothetical protein